MSKYGWFEVKTRDGKIGWVWSEDLAPIEDSVSREPEAQAGEIKEWPWLEIARKELGVKEMSGAGDTLR